MKEKYENTTCILKTFYQTFPHDFCFLLILHFVPVCPGEGVHHGRQAHGLLQPHIDAHIRQVHRSLDPLHHQVGGHHGKVTQCIVALE